MERLDTYLRNCDIVSMHKAGITFREIGKKFGISGQRAEQIFKRQTTRRVKSSKDPESLSLSCGIENAKVISYRKGALLLQSEDGFGVATVGDKTVAPPEKWYKVMGYAAKEFRAKTNYA